MEVEMKVPIKDEDVYQKTMRSLKELGIELENLGIQRDVYFKEIGFREKPQGPGSFI